MTGPGYPVVLTNASVLVAGLLPVEYVPLVTTAIGFAVQALLVSEFFGFDAAVRLSQWYARSAGSIEVVLVSAASVALIGCGFAFGVSRDATRRSSLLLAAAYCSSAIIGIFGALDPQGLLAKPFLRYLFVPNVILLLLIGHLGSRLRPWIGVVALAWVVAVNTPIPSTLQAIFFDGPSWRAQIPGGG